MLITVKQYPLETKRTFLRAFNQSDLNDFFEYAKVEGVGEMAGWIHHNNPSETQMILDSFIDKDNVYAIVDKKSLKVIGSLGLEDSKYYQHLKIVEIGYVLAQSFWGQGLMAEVVNCVNDHLFNVVGLDGITVTHFDFNKQSQRVIEKCGFKFIESSPFYSKQLKKSLVSHRYLKLKDH